MHDIKEAFDKPSAGSAGTTLDLRRCATGDLDAALDLADAFVPGGQVLALGHGAGPKSAKTYVSTKKATAPPNKMDRMMKLKMWMRSG